VSERCTERQSLPMDTAVCPRFSCVHRDRGLRLGERFDETGAVAASGNVDHPSHHAHFRTSIYGGARRGRQSAGVGSKHTLLGVLTLAAA
jgi:hypothetical protein